MAEPHQISCSEAGAIKAALLDAVKTGAHGATQPHALAESLISAFAFIDRSTARRSPEAGGTA
jgi:hypothetical protein